MAFLLCACTKSQAPEPVPAPTTTQAPEPTLHEWFQIPEHPEEGTYESRKPRTPAVLGIWRAHPQSKKLKIVYTECGTDIDCRAAVPRRDKQLTRLTAKCLYRHRHMSPAQLVRPKEEELYFDIKRLGEGRVSLEIHKTFMTHGMPLVDAIVLQGEMHRL